MIFDRLAISHIGIQLFRVALLVLIISISGYLALEQTPTRLSELWRRGVPLVEAVASNDNRQIEMALARGEDVNARSASGYTSLMWAAESGRLDLVNTLIERGADVNAVSDTGLTPLALAASSGQIDVMARLVAEGALVNQPLRDHYTALHAAALHGREASARWLIDHGAQLDTKDDRGDTPLQVAIDAIGVDSEMARFLRNAYTAPKQTPSH